MSAHYSLMKKLFHTLTHTRVRHLQRQAKRIERYPKKAVERGKKRKSIVVAGARLHDKEISSHIVTIILFFLVTALQVEGELKNKPSLRTPGIINHLNGSDFDGVASAHTHTCVCTYLNKYALISVLNISTPFFQTRNTTHEMEKYTHLAELLEFAWVSGSCPTIDHFPHQCKTHRCANPTNNRHMILSRPHT